MAVSAPYLIFFQQKGSPEAGYINIAEQDASIPFEVSRVSWIYLNKEEKKTDALYCPTESVLVATQGQTQVKIKTVENDHSTHSLLSPDQGLYIPSGASIDIYCKESCIVLVMAAQ